MKATYECVPRRIVPNCRRHSPCGWVTSSIFHRSSAQKLPFHSIFSHGKPKMFHVLLSKRPFRITSFLHGSTSFWGRTLDGCSQSHVNIRVHICIYRMHRTRIIQRTPAIFWWVDWEKPGTKASSLNNILPGCRCWRSGNILICRLKQLYARQRNIETMRRQLDNNNRAMVIEFTKMLVAAVSVPSLFFQLE